MVRKFIKNLLLFGKNFKNLMPNGKFYKQAPLNVNYTCTGANYFPHQPEAV